MGPQFNRIAPMGTVAKALSLLGHFSQTRTEIGLSDLTRLSGMNKATVYRLMTELQAEGLVEQVPGARSYRLGAELLRLAALREAAVPLLGVARQMLSRLADATGETAHMSIVQGRRLNALAHEYSQRHGTRVMMHDAEILSFHATASGLAVLAFAAPDLVRAALAPPLHRFTPQTETDPDRVRAALEEVRRAGLAEAVGGFEADVHSHAAPVFGPDSAPLGALAVAAPVSRMTVDLRARVRAELVACAADMTRAIGGFAPAGFPRREAAE